MSNYVPALSLSDVSVEPPDLLDWIEFEFEGVKLRVRGVLHGLTGGANREYIDLVERSLSAAQGSGLIMAEKSMKAMYRGHIDKELDDWLVFRPRDAFMLGTKLFFVPSLLWMLATGAIKERFTRRDEFAAGGRSDPDLIGGSPLFHRVDPFERRVLAGFASTVDAVNRHIDLRLGVDCGETGKAVVPGTHWRHLNVIERHSLIPIRSVHMLHYAVAYARREGVDVVNVFVGETHNTDMATIARRWSSLKMQGGRRSLALEAIASLARRAADGGMGRVEKVARYLAYIGSLSAPLYLVGFAAVAAAVIVGSVG